MLEDSENATISVKALTRCRICKETSIRSPPGVQGTMVWRAAIRGSPELRNFEIQDPWDMRKSSELGEDARQEWRPEQESPLLAEIPVISPEADTILKELVNSAPNRASSFSEHKCGEIATRWGFRIKKAGSVGGEAHCYISVWRKDRGPATLPPEHRHIYKSKADKELYDYAHALSPHGTCQIARHSYTLPTSPTHRSRTNPFKPGWIYGRMWLKGDTSYSPRMAQNSRGPPSWQIRRPLRNKKSRVKGGWESDTFATQDFKSILEIIQPCGRYCLYLPYPVSSGEFSTGDDGIRIFLRIRANVM